MENKCYEGRAKHNPANNYIKYKWSKNSIFQNEMKMWELYGAYEWQVKLWRQTTDEKTKEHVPGLEELQ